MYEITYQRLGFVLYPDNESLAIKKESGKSETRTFENLNSRNKHKRL